MRKRRVTMMMMRKYFRGSGRVLVFVFVASVVWLLLDMAALRISISDADGRLLQERAAARRQRDGDESRRSQTDRVQREEVKELVPEEIWRNAAPGPPGAGRDERAGTRTPQIRFSPVSEAQRPYLERNGTKSSARNATFTQASFKSSHGGVDPPNPTRRRTSGVHRVVALDVTLEPRDVRAVGQFGHAALVPKDKEAEARSRWSEGHFNVFLSEQIPVDRSIPDTRPPSCAENVVHDDLPTTSVIFCFVDEVWSTLLRSVHSVLNRSPPHLLKEIILVDDCSTKEHLKEQLDAYVSQLPNVRIVRLKERQGLIRARLAGAAVAAGEVLTFLDSHVECNVGWLEPLLERVYMDRRKVVCPVIEVISDKDMSYVMVDNFQRGIFRWPLVFGWSTLPKEQIRKAQMKDSDPIRCPVMAGGLFSIDKSYFYELGTYDKGLDVWGGENMEISFKIWMCGGEIEIIPCSRVGHIFRGENPYKFPKDRQKTVERNLARVAEVWLDEYKDLFYGHGYVHLLDKSAVDVGNLTEQRRLRERLQCKSFRWYLENIYPEMDAPVVKASGLVFNLGTRKCLALQNTSLSFEVCDLNKQNQHFNYTWLRLVRQQDLCLAARAAGTSVSLEPCDNTKALLRWLHKSSNKALEEHVIMETSPRRMCLEAGSLGDSVSVKECAPSSPFQKWHFTHYYAQ